MKRLFTPLLFSLLALTLTAAAQSPDELKTRFRERLPELNALKDAGTIGENADGYVEFVNDKKDKDKKENALVRAENDDRKVLYKSIAESTGTTTELVGQRRALKIAAEAPEGHYLKDDKGVWQKKP